MPAVSLIACTVIVYVQDTVSWTLGFALPASAMATAVLLFLAGSKHYRCVCVVGGEVRGGESRGEITASGVCGSRSGVCQVSACFGWLVLLTVCAAALCGPACCHRHVAPTESPMARVVKVVAAALHNR